MTKISTFLLDDHAAIRQGLGSLLQSEADIALVGEADHGSRAVRLISKTRPDVVVMDDPRPAMDGSQVARRILRIVPGARIVALISYGDDERVAQLMHAGVVGFLVKQTAVNDVVRAVREVRRGTFFSPLITSRMRPGYPAPWRERALKRKREPSPGWLRPGGIPIVPNLSSPAASVEASRGTLATA
jgi:DNA-binding NarL/FixJ family response regulator